MAGMQQHGQIVYRGPALCHVHHPHHRSSFSIAIPLLRSLLSTIIVPPLARMCIYYRDLIEYGDYRKTRIEYCHLTNDLPLNSRGNLTCHVPGDHSDTIIRNIDANQAVRQQQAQRGTLLLRSSQRRFTRLHEDISADRIYIQGISASLMRFEDDYRTLGYRYYAAGAWYAHSTLMVPVDLYRAVIQAFHSVRTL
jgi:hypothetical protein